MCDEDAQLVKHLDSPEDKGFVRAVALLEVRPHGCGGEMEGEGTSNDEHGWGVDVGEGQVTYKLSLDDIADVRKVSTEVVHVADGRAGCDSRLDLAEVFLALPRSSFASWS